MRNLLLWCAPYKWRILGGILGLLVAILMLTIGFFPTLLIVIFVSAGTALGYCVDDKVPFSECIARFRQKPDKDDII